MKGFRDFWLWGSGERERERERRKRREEKSRRGFFFFPRDFGDVC